MSDTHDLQSRFMHFVLKHAPNVMGSAYALQDAYEAAGFPRGLFVNLVAGNDTVARVIEDPRIAAVTLTGSMRAGAAVAATASVREGTSETTRHTGPSGRTTS